MFVCLCVNIDCEEELLRTQYIIKEQQSEKEKQRRLTEAALIGKVGANTSARTNERARQWIKAIK